MKLTKQAKQEALEALKKCAENKDSEAAHTDADDILLMLIDDVEITKAYRDVRKWYG